MNNLYYYKTLDDIPSAFMKYTNIKKEASCKTCPPDDDQRNADIADILFIALIFILLYDAEIK